jgi:lipopolysaccharide export system protein LptA
MRTTQANRYARWSAILAALLVAGVLTIYVRRAWQAEQAKKDTPAAVPSSIEKTSQGFSFSKMNGDRILFTIRASNATEFKEGGVSVLQDVWITIYGVKGDRADEIHTHSCDYLSNPDRMVCSGDVQMDLQSAEEVRRSTAAHLDPATGPNVVHVLTKAVTFDRDSGDSQTDAPVQFKFKGGQGRALGATFHSADGTLELRHDVHVTLIPAGLGTSKHLDARAVAHPAAPAQPVEVSGSSLDYHRETLVMLLHGPVLATQQVERLPRGGADNGQPVVPIRGSRELRAGLLTVNLDKEFHARRLTATGNSDERPEVRSTDTKGSGSLTADQLILDLSPTGWAEHFTAVGNAQGDYKTAIESDHISANRMNAEMVPKINQPRTLTADGDVQVNSSRGASTRTIQTAAAELDFVPGPPPRPGAPPSYHPGSAKTLAPATVTWRDPSPGLPAGQQRVTRASGQRVEAAFDERHKMRRLLAHGNTELDRETPGKPRQTSTSQELAADFDALGQWTTVDQTGNVHLREADRTAQAAREHVDRAANLVTLTGSSEASDATTHTTADTIVFNQNTSDMRADGHVLTTYKSNPATTPAKPAGASPATSSATPAINSGMGASTSLAPEPAHITSEHLVGNSASGHAVYTGHARLWQGDSIIEGDEIELNRDARQLDARGNVRAAFLQVNAPPVGANSSAPAGKGTASLPAARKSAAPADTKPAQPDVMRIRSGTLTYWDLKHEAHLDHGFTGESQQGVITSQECELYFTTPTQPAAPGIGTAQRLDHAIATGNVVVRQTGRHATGDRGDYEPAQGKFILSGANPTIYDAFGNSTRGRQLTFFLADDTILVESDEGSRVVTLYRVQK